MNKELKKIGDITGEVLRALPIKRHKTPNTLKGVCKELNIYYGGY